MLRPVSPERFLDRLDPNDRAAIESVSSRRSYSKGAVLFLDGDKASEVLLITSGQIKLVVASTDGREVLLEIRGAGEVIGEMALLDDSPRSASAFALTSPTEVLVVGTRDFRRLVDTEFGLTRTLLDEMVRKVRDSTFHRLELGLDDVAGRVSRRLNELARRFGEADADGTMSFRSPITQQELADWSGVSRQAVVKELTRMRELGWLETKGSSVVIHNPEAIAERAAKLWGSELGA